MSTYTMVPFQADPDIQLMTEASRGDTAGLAMLIEKHYPAVLRYCMRRVGNSAEAEELAQEVFLRVHRSRVNYQASAKFTTWLYRIASNVVLNWIRDTARERSWERLDAPRTCGPNLQVRDTSLPADERMAREARALQVRRALKHLPERQRTIVHLHSFEEMPGPEIAETLGCTHQAVRSQLFRAYAALRSHLSELGPALQ